MDKNFDVISSESKIKSKYRMVLKYKYFSEFTLTQMVLKYNYFSILP